VLPDVLQKIFGHRFTFLFDVNDWKGKFTSKFCIMKFFLSDQKKYRIFVCLFFFDSINSNDVIKLKTIEY